jgi:hypothetical protein
MYPTSDGLTFDVLAYSKLEAIGFFAEWLQSPVETEYVCRVVFGRRRRSAWQHRGKIRAEMTKDECSRLAQALRRQEQMRLHNDSGLPCLPSSANAYREGYAFALGVCAKLLDSYVETWDKY